jgi:hypothetical protein
MSGSRKGNAPGPGSLGHMTPASTTQGGLQS